jgi:hypothetical protein
VDLVPTLWISLGGGRGPLYLKALGPPGGGGRRALVRCGRDQERERGNGRSGVERSDEATGLTDVLMVAFALSLYM